MPSPLVHIGYHKTATSWLQRRLFVPACGYRQIATHQEVWDWIVAPFEHGFVPEPIARKIAERVVGCPTGQVPVISSEILCGNPFFGGEGRARNADRLAKLIPDAKILITIRAQPQMLRSVYMQYLHRGGTEPPAQFFSEQTEPGYARFAAEQFCYDRLIDLYSELFEDVLVLPQEAIARDPRAVNRALNSFAGLSGDADLVSAGGSEVPSPSEAIAPMLRRANHVRRAALNRRPVLALLQETGTGYRLLHRLGRSQAVRALPFKPVSTHIKARFATRFRDSNARLKTLGKCPFPLDAYR